MMDIDRPRNKRSRDEPDLDAHDNHSAKRTRLADDSFTQTFAGADASSPSASSDMDTDMDSAASTPSPMNEDAGVFFASAAQPTFQQAQSRSTIISGLNQARRTEDLRIACPWLFA